MFCEQYRKLKDKYNSNSWPRIEIALRGEPLLNPYKLQCLKVIREVLPKCQITLFSNGVSLLPDKRLLNRLFEAGLNVLYVDCYQSSYKQMEKHCQRHKSEEVELFDAHDFIPYRKHPRGFQRKVISLIVGLEDRENSLKIRPIYNVGGYMSYKRLKPYGVTPKELPLQANCTRAHREMIWHSTGNVPLCCVDWKPKDKMLLGNIWTETLEEMWFGKIRLQGLRRLWKKDRDWGLCMTCDFPGGYRQGFLRNPFIEVSPLR